MRRSKYCSLRLKEHTLIIAAFLGDICDKQYGRIDELDKHENSEAHMHRVRHRDLMRAHGSTRSTAGGDEAMKPIPLHKSNETPSKPKGGFFFRKYDSQTGEMRPAEGKTFTPAPVDEPRAGLGEHIQNHAQIGNIGEATVQKPSLPGQSDEGRELKGPISAKVTEFDPLGKEPYDSDDEIYGHYDPRYPLECWPSCVGDKNLGGLVSTHSKPGDD